MKKKIAITGGIGSGKSTATRILKEAGYPVYSCDEIYKDISQSLEYVEEIRRVFPHVVENRQINKTKLAKTAFDNEENRKRLNAISHPKIMKRLQEEMEREPREVVFAEVPLLLEENYQTDFDEYIVVFRSMEKRIDSVRERDRLNKEQVIARMRAQYDYEKTGVREELEKSGARVITNEGTEEALAAQLFALLRDIL